MTKAMEAAADAMRRYAHDNGIVRSWQDYAQAAIAAYLAQREADGFVMVPVEPTEAMIRAAWAVEDSAPRHQVMTREMYIAMIAARPKGEVK